MSCINHKDKASQFQCTTCGKHFCQECITLREISRDFIAHICKECGGRCQARKDSKKSEKKIKKLGRDILRDVYEKLIILCEKYAKKWKVKTNFLLYLLFVAVYPIKKYGLFITAVAAGVMWAIPMVRLPWNLDIALTVVFAAYGAVYLFRIVDDSSQGLDCLPRLIDTEYWIKSSKVVSVCTVMLMFCIAPAHAYFYFTNRIDVIFSLLLCVGIFYFPMVFVRTTFMPIITALNPVGIFASIFKSFGAYFLLCFSLVGFASFFVYIALDFLNTHTAVSYVAGYFLFMYLLFCQMYLVGLFVRRHGAKIAGMRAG